MGGHLRIPVGLTAVVLVSGIASCLPTEPPGDGPVIVTDAPGDPASDGGTDLPGKDLADVVPDVPGKDATDLPFPEVAVDVPAEIAPADVPPDVRTIACVGPDPWFPTFDRACLRDGDCGVALHQTNCCGSEDALGIAAAQKAAFDEAETTCRNQYPMCGCASAPPMMDDGLFATDPSTIGVACRDGRCTTYATDACERAAEFEALDACTADGDCAVAFHQVNCCGTLVAWGIAAVQATDFGVTEASCQALLPDCKCAQQATQAQDGNSSWSPAEFAVSCLSGHCRSRVEKAPADTCTGMVFGTCGDPDLSCQCCPAGGPTQHCLCSTPCKTAGECTDPARPVCNQVAGAVGFCAPAGFQCCWLCL